MHVVLEPYQKITIKSYLRHENPEAFVGAITHSLVRGAGGRVGGLLWANGVVFRHFNYAPSESINKEYLKGHLPIDYIEFAPMSEFRGEIHTGDFIATVLDVSNHSTFAKLAEWITNNLLSSKKTKARR